MAIKKKNKKIIIIALIVAIVVAAVIAGIAIYKNVNSKLYSGEGAYYYQQDKTTTLNFKDDNTFSFIKQADENTNDVITGKWAEKDGEITLTFDDASTVTFVKTEDGYLYRKDKIYRGKTSEKKLLNNMYVLEEDGAEFERLCFMDDGTMEITQGKTITSRGTYTRVDNILIVRRTTIPDSYGKKIDVTERYLVLDNGITKEIYSKTPAENVAK